MYRRVKCPTKSFDVRGYKYLLKTGDAEDNDVEREGPEGHAVKQQGQPEPQPHQVASRPQNRPPHGADEVLHLRRDTQ